MIPTFQIELHSRDLPLLKKIQSFFGVGSISVRQRDNQVIYTVRSLNDLTDLIIPHFDKYPLLTKKRADFLLFKSVLELINQKEHLTMEGLAKILSIRASMNNGLTQILMESFPNITPVPRPVVSDQGIKDPNWLAGFSFPPPLWSLDLILLNLAGG